MVLWGLCGTGFLEGRLRGASGAGPQPPRGRGLGAARGGAPFVGMSLSLPAPSRQEGGGEYG